MFQHLFRYARGSFSFSKTVSRYLASYYFLFLNHASSTAALFACLHCIFHYYSVAWPIFLCMITLGCSYTFLHICHLQLMLTFTTGVQSYLLADMLWCNPQLGTAGSKKLDEQRFDASRWYDIISLYSECFTFCDNRNLRLEVGIEAMNRCI